jgi:hypothetical protein
MSEQLQFIIVVALGGLCFGCGYLVAFIVTRNKWREEMIRRGVARYNSQTGKWEWGSYRRNRGRGKYSERGGLRPISPSCRN